MLQSGGNGIRMADEFERVVVIRKEA
jgi:hypothetical protein